MKRRGIGVFIGVASLVTLVIAVWFGIQQADLAKRQTAYSHCQAAVNDALVAAQNARATFADQDRAALDRMVLDITKATSRADTEAALQRYQQTRATTDLERAQHPLPAPPSQAC